MNNKRKRNDIVFLLKRQRQQKQQSPRQRCFKKGAGPVQAAQRSYDSRGILSRATCVAKNSLQIQAIIQQIIPHNLSKKDKLYKFIYISFIFPPPFIYDSQAFPPQGIIFEKKSYCTFFIQIE